jgi:hypothetical protein
MLKPMRAFLGVLLTLPFYGQQALNVGPSAPKGPLHTITGTVVNALSGVPIRHALVQASGMSGGSSALTGPDGRFQLTNIPEGPIRLFAQKPGFFDANSESGNFGGYFDLKESLTVGPDKNDFTLTLFPSAKIVGRITDADGEPAENISLQLLNEMILQGRKLTMARENASTDDDGVYRIDGLLPGRYKLFANGHVLPAATLDAPPELSAPAYYPDGPDLASAQTIDIKAGQEIRADFHLRSERGYRVSGKVSGIPTTTPVGFSFTNASGQNVVFGAMTFDQEKGTFTAQAVPSGTYTVNFSSNEGPASTYGLRQEIVVDGADVSDLQFVLHSFATIPVQVNHATDIAPPNGGLNAALIALEPFQYSQYGLHAEGSPPVFTFNNVPAGKYRLSMQSSGSECLESAAYGSIDLTRDYLVVGAGEQPLAITIKMRADCATLTVKLQPAEHPRDAFLIVVPSSALAEPEIQGVAKGSAGSFTLSPGSYQVFAFSTVDGLEYANPEALRGYPSQTVNLDPGQKTEITVEPSERKGS